MPSTLSDADLLKSLRQEHPRLIVLEADVERARESIKSNPLAKAWYNDHRALAERMFDSETHGENGLFESRDLLRRVLVLAGLYRISGERRYAQRAIHHMLAAACDPRPWGLTDFLAVSEKMTALAVGYDWLFDLLTAEQKTLIREAVLDRGLTPAIGEYAKQTWWTQTYINWGSVCAAGITIACLAFADENPDMARRLIPLARHTMEYVMNAWAPDGGYEESVTYWMYGTLYNVLYLQALDTALATDFGFTIWPGFSRTGLFRMHAIGPTGKAYQFGDGRQDPGPAPMMFWLARTFNKPEYAQHERLIIQNRGLFVDDHDRHTIFFLFWFFGGDPKNPSEQIENQPLDCLFRGHDLAFFRGAWNDPKTTYLAFKGGSNQANHCHLDLGSFCLDSGGVRWAIDLGPETYKVPGYFEKAGRRWNYYRCRTESHNTLIINGQNQDIKAKAPLVAYLSSPARSFAVADLSAAYAANTRRVLRGVALLDRRDLLVQDEVSADEPIELLWKFFTRAAIKIGGDGKSAVLTQDGATMNARLLEPAGGRFDVVSALSPPDQSPQDDVRVLLVRLDQKVTQTRIAVFLTPDENAKSPEIMDLSRWIGEGPIAPVPPSALPRGLNGSH